MNISFKRLYLINLNERPPPLELRGKVFISIMFFGSGKFFFFFAGIDHREITWKDSVS